MRPGWQTLRSSQTFPEGFVSLPSPPVPDAAADARTRLPSESAPVRWRSYESRDRPTRLPGSASAPPRLPLLTMAFHTVVTFEILFPSRPPTTAPRNEFPVPGAPGRSPAMLHSLAAAVAH